jgi:DNA-binding MarR family transcriptional regulator
MDIVVPENNGVYARNLLGRLRHLMFLARQRELAPLDISPRQVYILFLLCSANHPTTLAELAKYTDRGIGTISIQMTRMEKDGLVTKSRVKRKSSLVKFEVTQKGLDIYDAANKLQSEQEIMAVLSQRECQQFILTLKKLIAKAETYQ